MLTKSYHPFLFLFILSFSFFSCEKEKLKSFDLTIEELEEGFRCTWNTVNISSFQNYHLIYSDIPIGPIGDPRTFIPTQGVSIADPSVDSWDFYFFLKSPIIYFQLFVEIEGRFLKSDVRQFDNKNTQVLDIDFAKAIHYPEIERLFLLENSNEHFTSYSYKDREIKAFRDLPHSFTEYAVGDNGLEPELYLIKNGTALVALDAYTLEEKTNYHFLKPAHSLATNEKGMIAITVENEDASLYLFERNGWDILKTHKISNFEVSRGLGFLSKENNRLVEIDSDTLHDYTLNDLGEILTHQTIPNTFQSTTEHFKTLISPNENYLISSSQGALFDVHLNGVGILNSITSKQYMQYLFSQDESKLYALNEVAAEVDIFSIPDLELMETVSFERIEPKFLFDDNGEIMIIGTIPSFDKIIIRPLKKQL